MPGELVLDTGALVTLLDRSQAHHEAFARFFESWKKPVISSEPVLTEATHLLGRVPGGSRTCPPGRACLEFFLGGGQS